MAITDLTKHQASRAEEVEEEELSLECRELLVSLPKERGWRTRYLYQFQGFWCQAKEIQSILSFQKHFKAKDTDVVLATIPKSGTTWLKALAFTVLNRKCYPPFDHDKNHPLLHSNSHDLVPFFEYRLYSDNKIPNLSDFHDPRLFATHIRFSSLPESIKTSKCRIVYIHRNPLDTFVSSWHFINKVKPESQAQLPLEEAFEMYCKGIVGFGPFWDHMLGYWRESQREPSKVLILTYEDVKKDVISNLKRLAKFLGLPFTAEEERAGVVEEIARLCSFEKMKDVAVNKNGKSIMNWENRNLFRKGEVGDWMNYLSPEMVEELSRVLEEKLGGSGLTFKF